MADASRFCPDCREEIKKDRRWTYETETADIFDFGIPLPGTGLRRRGAAHPAYSALSWWRCFALPIRPKNSTTGLWALSFTKTSGVFCEEKGHDGAD